MLLAVKFSEFIVKANVIIGIIIAAIGIASIIVAGRLSQAIDKSDKINKSGKTYIVCKVVGLVCILLGMILIALPI